MNGLSRLSFFRRRLFSFIFLGHIFEFARFKYVAAFLTFHVFRILVTRHDLHLRMFALLWFDPGRGLRRLACRHKTGFDEYRSSRKLPYFRTPVQDVKYLLNAGVPW